ncbi:YkyB family protein [Calidifontibacillus oryziterrae]|uniref:YkyB family protein n=1 Tax=Calidifontibacillus oryziterrae TaxID=1191699 RepID=UPI0002F327AC|nr:YkyB family protein [Calidifontibacillus oryziterrae]
MEYSTEELSRALFVVNRHAKTAPNPKFLYTLKKKALDKLIHEGKAKKCGLHYSKNPKNSQQRSDLLVSVGDYYFHIPPTKIDFEKLPHLGELNESYRNPKTHLSLTRAKQILQSYTGFNEATDDNKPHPPTTKKYQKPVFKKLGQSYF